MKKKTILGEESSLLSSLDKESSLLEVLTFQDHPVHDGIVFLTEGFDTHKYAKTEAVTGGMYDSLFEAFERTWSANKSFTSLKDHKNEVILEMGCADMSLYNTFKAMHTYPNYIGIDIRRDYLLSGANRHRKNVIGMCADLMKPLPIKSDSISAIVISEVIEHLTHEQNLITFKEAHRILKPGGKIFVSSPVNTRDREFHNVEKEKNLGHVFFWEAEQFEEDMEQIGFSSVDKKWGYSISSQIKVHEIKKNLPEDVCNFLSEISDMYGSRVARALALSASGVVNGGCRFTVTK